MRRSSNDHMSPERFVETFGPALQEYLEQSYGKDDNTHVCDMLAHSGGFFDATYHSISAFLYNVDYTEANSFEAEVAEEEE